MEAEDTERMRRRPAHMPAGPPPQEPHIEEDPTALSAGVKRPPRYPRSDASRDEDTATEVVIRNKPEGD